MLDRLIFLVWLCLAAFVGTCLALHAACAHDGMHDAWYSSLKQPGTNTSCCNLTDCKDEPYRQTKNGYEVLIDGEWVEVPQEKILRGIENPTGHAVTCHIGRMIFCFVRETES